jgi:16S rRNA (guanine966-N2)-methyltransferase
MRIIAGKHRSKTLQPPKDRKIRPTADRVKEAIFSTLEAKMGIQNCKFLDAFCGSGAMGLEAISRGAEYVCFMDTDIRLAKENSKKISEENIRAISCDVLNPPKSSTIMDIVFIDPPYAETLGSPAIKSLLDSGWANEDTLFVLETDKNDDSIKEEDYSEYKMKKYGNTIVYYIKAY